MPESNNKQQNGLKDDRNMIGKDISWWRYTGVVWTVCLDGMLRNVYSM